jgi:hypothetical protein
MSIAAQILYKDQYIAAFERRESILRPTVTTDTESRGSQVYFLIAGSNNRAAVTRGSNGLIPPSDDSQVQVPITFAEAHDLNEKTNFDIFKAQGNQLQLMRENGIGVINRAIDAAIITALTTGTVSLGAVGAMSKTIANRIATILRNATVGEVDMGNLYCLVTPAAFSYLTDITSFANTLYSTATGGKVDEGIPQLGRWKFWMGMNWGEHSGLAGIGTSTATCLAWHKASTGHAIASGTIDAAIGRDEKQDTSWARHSVYQGASKLQNSGIVKFTHDDSGLSS